MLLSALTEHLMGGAKLREGLFTKTDSLASLASFFVLKSRMPKREKKTFVFCFRKTFK